MLHDYLYSTSCWFLLNVSTHQILPPQLTRDITKSCDYASNQRVLQVYRPTLFTILTHVTDPYISAATAFWGFANLRIRSTLQWCRVLPNTTPTFGRVTKNTTSSKTSLQSALCYQCFSLSSAIHYFIFHFTGFVSWTCLFAAHMPTGNSPSAA